MARLGQPPTFVGLKYHFKFKWACEVGDCYKGKKRMHMERIMLS